MAAAMAYRTVATKKVSRSASGEIPWLGWAVLALVM
jgi:hypothetical protein